MNDTFTALQTPAPTFSVQHAAELLRKHYGIDAEPKPLVSERDQNFLAASSNGTNYVLKIANASEPEAITDFQNQGLLHIARVDPGFPVPRVIPTRAGGLLFNVESALGEAHNVRLLSWLDGVPLHQAEGVVSVARQAGTCLAKLGLMLRDFEHPASDYPLLWDIRNAASLRELLQYVDDDNLRSHCEQRVEHFCDVTSPHLATLRSQVIYNDMNTGNVLVHADDVNRVAGVIDFGDMIHSQLVNDVAVACSYFCRLDDEPFEDVTKLLEAYTSILPLTEEEIAVLPDLILTRRLTTVLIAHWRASLYPKNADYILRDEGRARQMLYRVAGLSISDTVERFLDVCSVGARQEAGT